MLNTNFIMEWHPQNAQSWELLVLDKTSPLHTVISWKSTIWKSVRTCAEKLKTDHDVVFVFLAYHNTHRIFKPSGIEWHLPLSCETFHFFVASITQIHDQISYINSITICYEPEIVSFTRKRARARLSEKATRKKDSEFPIVDHCDFEAQSEPLGNQK